MPTDTIESLLDLLALVLIIVAIVVAQAAIDYWCRERK